MITPQKNRLQLCRATSKRVAIFPKFICQRFADRKLPSNNFGKSQHLIQSLSFRFPRFAPCFSRENNNPYSSYRIMLICFLSCVFFSFPSCARDKYLHKAHIRLLARSLTFTFVHLFTHSPRHVEPTVECAPRRTKKNIYYTFFSGSFVCVCIF